MSAKHSLVIGGTRGLGREVVRLFSDLGHEVSVIGSRSPVEADLECHGVQYVTADILDAAVIEKTLADLLAARGTLDSLIFLQRYRGQGDAWQGEFDTTLTATRRIIDQLTDEFRPNGTRSIVVVSSLLGRMVWGKQALSYHLTKAALEQLAAWYAVNLGPKGIRVNGVSPLTFLKEESQAFYLGDERLTRLYNESIPLGRMPTARDIARVIRFLCSEDAAFITGQILVVDGGLTLQFQEGLARQLAGLE